MKKGILGIAILISLIVLSSCSVVFRAGVGGLIKDEATSLGIEGMQVYVYTEKSARDTDYGIFSADSSKVGQSSSYRGRTTTANDGSFYFSRIIWETKSPTYGKTADYREVFFLYYHESYGVLKSNDAIHYMIASDSNNESVVNESFSKIDTIVNIALSVENFVTRNLVNTQIKATVEGPSKTFEQTFNAGTTTLSVSYPIDHDQPQAKIKLSVELWDMVNSQGNIITEHSLALSGAPISLKLYLKEQKPNFPSLQGRIIIDSVTDTNNNNQTIYLGYKDSSDNQLKRFEQITARVVTELEETGDFIRHGMFSSLGRGLTYDEVHDKVKGTNNVWSEVYLIWDSDNDGILTFDGSTDAWCKITVDQGGNTFNVGVRSTWQKTWP